MQLSTKRNEEENVAIEYKFLLFQAFQSNGLVYSVRADVFVYTDEMALDERLSMFLIVWKQAMKTNK